MSLSRDAILSARANWPRVDVPAPELGDGATVSVGTLSLGQAERIRNMQDELRETPLQIYAQLAVESVKNADGSPAFIASDLAAVVELPFTLLERIALAALKLNGMGKDDVKDAEKN